MAWPLIVGALAYCAFYLYLTAVPLWMCDVEYDLLPLLSVGIGVLVGYKVRRWGWALGAVPALLVFIPIVIAHHGPPTLPFAFFKLPVSILCSMFGGFIGERLTHPE